MRQVRNGVFETNSSSCHSICIQKDKNITLPNNIYFYTGEYGWEFDCVDTASYLYTLILNSKDKEEKLNTLKNILDKHSISYTFEELKTGYVDHGYEAADFVDAVLNDEDLLLRCLFGTDSCVYTGNDNSAEEDDMCYCAIATDEHWNGKEWVTTVNPRHEPDKYDYFYKGN